MEEESVLVQNLKAAYQATLDDASSEKLDPALQAKSIQSFLNH